MRCAQIRRWPIAPGALLPATMFNVDSLKLAPPTAPVPVQGSHTAARDLQAILQTIVVDAWNAHFVPALACLTRAEDELAAKHLHDARAFIASRIPEAQQTAASGDSMKLLARVLALRHASPLPTPQKRKKPRVPAPDPGGTYE